MDVQRLKAKLVGVERVLTNLARERWSTNERFKDVVRSLAAAHGVTRAHASHDFGHDPDWDNEEGPGSRLYRARFLLGHYHGQSIYVRTKITVLLDYKVLVEVFFQADEDDANLVDFAPTSLKGFSWAKLWASDKRRGRNAPPFFKYISQALDNILKREANSRVRVA